MIPTNVGDVVKFHTPYPDEDPNQLYVVVELMTDVEKPRALIKAVSSDSLFTSTNTVLINDLETVQIDTSELIGYYTSIKLENDLTVLGTVVKVNETKQRVSLHKATDGVDTNVMVTILDENERKITGNLFVNKLPPNETNIRRTRKLH
jgi:hypothetical protein